MLFNSYAFLFVFLPLALIGYALAVRIGHKVSLVWLAICSLAFYGYWNPRYLVLIAASICFNFVAGHMIGRATDALRKQVIFVIGVAANILLLGFFKYLGPSANFLSSQGIIERGIHLDIILPLGISFFTFTQIGYLVDRRDGIGKDLGFVPYTVFVTFFPHLIAGPILHIREVGPQLLDRTRMRLRAESFAPGLTMFTIGLVKKVLLADPLSPVVAAGFSHAGGLSLFSSWSASLAYMAQLYFDFSGYSDMAIGLAAMFGVRFPLNFNSPLKATSIIDFWQRWHMTLTRYLGLLLYNPVAFAITRRHMARGLKVSPKALARPGAFLSMVAVPTFYTMILAGIWHGAGLQFVVFGLMHGVYLVVNHAWRILGTQGKHASATRFPLAGFLLTQLAVLASFVFFRAASCTDALRILASMIGWNGFGLHLDPAVPVVRLVLSLSVIWFAPNSQQILGRFAPILEKVEPSRWLQWRPTVAYGIAVAVLLALAIVNLTRTSEFLYFQF